MDRGHEKRRKTNSTFPLFFRITADNELEDRSSADESISGNAKTNTAQKRRFLF